MLFWFLLELGRCKTIVGAISNLQDGNFSWDISPTILLHKNFSQNILSTDPRKKIFSWDISSATSLERNFSPYIWSTENVSGEISSATPGKNICQKLSRQQLLEIKFSREIFHEPFHRKEISSRLIIPNQPTQQTNWYSTKPFLDLDFSKIHWKWHSLFKPHPTENRS